jgi:type II secretory pathway component PulK
MITPSSRATSRHTHRSRRGVALLLTLWLVIILATVSMAASSAARGSSSLVLARRAGATAQSMAESGITAALATINDSLRVYASDSISRDAFLNALDQGTHNGATSLGRAKSDTVVDGAFALAVVDISARLDVNTAGETSLATFLATYTGAADARILAARIVARVRGDAIANDSAGRARSERDSTIRALLGQQTTVNAARNPFESIDQLVEIPGMTEKLIATIAPFITVDGDATINQRSAPTQVMSAAPGGTLVDRPSRLLVISRGWQLGHPLTREIQAVYEITPTGLALVRWRERAL